jgi:hypothetical protein
VLTLFLILRRLSLKVKMFPRDRKKPGNFQILARRVAEGDPAECGRCGDSTGVHWFDASAGGEVFND